MNQFLTCILLFLSVARISYGHFVFVVPEADGATAKVVLSENLDPDAEVKLLVKTTLSVLGADGSTTPLSLNQADPKFLTVAVAGSGTRVIHGASNLGVMSHGKGKPHLLIYYPKTVIGNGFDAKTQLNGKAPVELIPVGDAGSFKLKLVAGGKAQPDAEITVLLPDGSEKKIKTDASGETESLSAKGRYGAWARYWEQTPGEHEGKKYEELRQYATLAFNTNGAAPTAETSNVQLLTNLPQATASFGSTVSDGWLYVYGGHTSPTHTYFIGAVSGKFNRVKLSANPTWESLPDGIAVQGLNLAAHNGKIYRIGGMEPRNERNKAADNHSLADAARYDVAAKKWEQLPALPELRSSHDVVVLDDKLYVVGGWALEGKKESWRNTVEVLDLKSSNPSWSSIPQPFQRRALMAAALDGKIYVIGGMNEKQKIVKNVSILDPKTKQWSEGPELPTGEIVGFAPAVGVHKGQIYLSVADGQLLRLNLSAGAWEKVATTSSRVAHRLASYDNSILLIGGAAKGKNLDLVEIVPDGK